MNYNVYKCGLKISMLRIIFIFCLLNKRMYIVSLQRDKRIDTFCFKVGLHFAYLCTKFGNSRDEIVNKSFSRKAMSMLPVFRSI